MSPSRGAAPVALLMGPTACGKTDLAVRAARELPVDIISVDSAMVYRHMDIGTGKPPVEVLRSAPHQLIDLCEAHEPYSAGDFVRDARGAIAASHQRGRLPLLVGGTNLYFNALREGIAELPAASPTIRAALAHEAHTLGWPALHARLARLDPRAAQRIHPHDPQRIQRALEVHALTGEALSDLQAARTRGAVADLAYGVAIVSAATRARLHERVEARFDQMLAAGFEAEVAGLLARPQIHADLPSMRAVGYRQMANYLGGYDDAAEMRERAIIATRQLAKRQTTWLRREREVRPLD